MSKFVRAKRSNPVPEELCRMQHTAWRCRQRWRRDARRWSRRVEAGGRPGPPGQGWWGPARPPPTHLWSAGTVSGCAASPALDAKGWLNQCCGSGMFTCLKHMVPTAFACCQPHFLLKMHAEITDPIFPSRIRIFSIPDPGFASKNLSILTKKLFISSRI